MSRGLKFFALFLLASTAIPAMADDVTYADQILCTLISATECLPDQPCESTSLIDSNVPRFIEIDLDKKEMRTTKASGLNRSTKIKNFQTDAGLLILQGYENGRAFSFLITEKTGMASIAVAREDLGVSIFGACTPLPAAAEKE